jgi:signal transduction histidine kinase
MGAATQLEPEDETERLKRENRELRARLVDMETMLTMLPVPIAISEDPEALKVEANPALAALLGVDTDKNVSLSGPTADQLPFRLLRNGKPIAPEDLPLQRAALTRKEVQDEFEVVREDGIRYHLFGSMKPLFDEIGKLRRVFGAFIDITERKRTETSLRQSMEALQKANDELQQFAYAASHDLQEPLRSIASYTQLLERRYGGDPNASEYTAFIVEGVNRMNLLIRDLLAYSRVGMAADLKRSSVNLNHSLQWALLNLDRSIQEKKATVTHDELPEVVASDSQMVQVLQNLIGNSLKYQSDLPPLIHVGAEETEDEVIVSVRDNGIGIDPQYAKQIFGVFKRLHGRDIPGTGIGLAICRKIVENHGGRIWVESDGSNGSTFYFTLPR